MKKLAIYFPGIGYHCDKPLLYYSRALALQLGYEEYRSLSYTFDGTNLRGNEEKMREAFECLYGQAVAGLEDIDWKEYDDILFVSKSIGTVISTAMAHKKQIMCRQILLTPLEQTYQFPVKDGIAFIGTCDPWSRLDIVKENSAGQDVPLYFYEGANHSLETGDTFENITILKDVLKKEKEYIIQHK